MVGEPNFFSEWSSIESLRAIKRKFPLLTTTASAKRLPEELLLSQTSISHDRCFFTHKYCYRGIFNKLTASADAALYIARKFHKPLNSLWFLYGTRRLLCNTHSGVTCPVQLPVPKAPLFPALCGARLKAGLPRTGTPLAALAWLS
jgi:hypothetical protein